MRLISVCLFSVERLTQPQFATPQFPHRFDNVQSYLMCPDRPAMKIDTSFPVSRIRVFYRKLPKRHHIRHHITDHSVVNQFHVTRSENTLPKNFIDVYHWSVD